LKADELASVFSLQAIHYLQFVGGDCLEFIRRSWITSTKENTASGLQVAFVTVKYFGSL
jgi:hypothetical protein